MKRRRFMEGLSLAALMHRELPENEIGAHEALTSLSADFRDSAKWYAKRIEKLS